MASGGETPSYGCDERAGRVGCVRPFPDCEYLKSPLLALAKRESGHTVEGAEVFGLDEIEAGIRDALQQSDDLRV